MDEFTREVTSRLAALAGDDDPPAGLAAGILRGARRRRSRLRAGTALACVLLATAGTVAVSAATRSWTAGARRQGQTATGRALAPMVGAAPGRPYTVPPRASVLALAATGAALAVDRDDVDRTLWLLRPDGGQVVLDRGRSDIAGWATDGTVTAWSWAAPVEGGWKCAAGGAAPVPLGDDPPVVGRQVYADAGHLVWTGAHGTHVLTDCNHVTSAPVTGRVVGLRWPQAFTVRTGGQVYAENLVTGRSSPVNVAVPAGPAAPRAIAAGGPGLLVAEVAGTSAGARWRFSGQRPAGTLRPLAGADYLGGLCLGSVGGSLLAVSVSGRDEFSTVARPPAGSVQPATSVVYRPATGRAVTVDGTVLVAGHLLLHQDGAGYRLYTLP
jgi:hypothetical protein